MKHNTFAWEKKVLSLMQKQNKKQTKKHDYKENRWHLELVPVTQAAPKLKARKYMQHIRMNIPVKNIYFYIHYTAIKKKKERIIEVYSRIEKVKTRRPATVHKNFVAQFCDMKIILIYFKWRQKYSKILKYSLATFF